MGKLHMQLYMYVLKQYRIISKTRASTTTRVNGYYMYYMYYFFYVCILLHIRQLLLFTNVLVSESYMYCTGLVPPRQPGRAGEQASNWLCRQEW